MHIPVAVEELEQASPILARFAARRGYDLKPGADELPVRGTVFFLCELDSNIRKPKRMAHGVDGLMRPGHYGDVGGVIGFKVGFAIEH